MMRKILLVFLILLPGSGQAVSEHSMQLRHMKPDLHDKPSLQRGLTLFSNYCLGCHDADYARFE